MASVICWASRTIKQCLKVQTETPEARMWPHNPILGPIERAMAMRNFAKLLLWLLMAAALIKWILI